MAMKVSVQLALVFFFSLCFTKTYSSFIASDEDGNLLIQSIAGKNVSLNGYDFFSVIENLEALKILAEEQNKTIARMQLLLVEMSTSLAAQCQSGYGMENRF